MKKKVTKQKGYRFSEETARMLKQLAAKYERNENAQVRELIRDAWQREFGEKK